MKKTLPCSFSFKFTVIFLTSFLTIILGVNHSLAQGVVWYVSISGSDETGDGSAENPFETIQKGIDSASGGDIVLVAPGTFNENVTLKQNVYLRGSGYEATTISAHDHVVTGADGSTIEGFMIVNDGQGLSWGYGWSESSTVIRNNVFKGHYVGLHCGQTGSSELIVNNVIIDNNTGITFGWDASPTIRNNIIVNCNVHWYDGGEGFDPSANIAYNDLWNGVYDFVPSPGTGNVSSDPLFANAADNDFRLLVESPCIDAGDPDPKYDDIDKTRNDMGVYGGPYGQTYDYSVPVELVSFVAYSTGNVVELHWTTATEANNYGFDVEKSADKTNFDRIGFVQGHGTTTALQSYRFIDKKVEPGMYFYRLKQIDTDGSFEYSSVIDIVISLPKFFSLGQNYPNPFNPETTIEYQLAEEGPVVLKIYNIRGSQIRTLVNTHRKAGYHKVIWDGKDDTGNMMSTGAYVYALKAGEFSDAKKFLLLK